VDRVHNRQTEKRRQRMTTRGLIATVLVLIVGGFFLVRTSAQRQSAPGGPNCVIPAAAGSFKDLDDDYHHMTFEDSAGTIRIYNTYPWQGVEACTLVFRIDRR
jgi:hypothetical protein